MTNKKTSFDEVKTVLSVGQYIIDEVEKGAAEEAKKELKFNLIAKKSIS